MEKKEVRFDLSKRVTVEFVKDFGAFKKGDTTEAGLVIAGKWVTEKLAKLSKEGKAYVDEHELGAMFGTSEASEETKD